MVQKLQVLVNLLRVITESQLRLLKGFFTFLCFNVVE